MVLDIANTGVARGKIYLARQKGLPIPLGWAINAEGEPTTDPSEAIDGIILPMAEHKGYAIATMMDVLSGRADRKRVRRRTSHGPYQTEKASGGRASDDRAQHRGDPAARRVPRAHGAADRASSSRCRSPRATTRSSTRGSIEARNDARNREGGIVLPEDTLADLTKLAKESGLESKLPFAPA